MINVLHGLAQMHIWAYMHIIRLHMEVHDYLFIRYKTHVHL